MRANGTLSMLMVFLLPAVGWAGERAPEVSVPVLSETGLSTLGVSLLGVGGLTLLRSKKH